MAHHATECPLVHWAFFLTFFLGLYSRTMLYLWRTFPTCLELILQVTIELLKKAMLKSGSRSFLIDGFPRALDQAQTFEDQIQPCDMVMPCSSCRAHYFLPFFAFSCLPCSAINLSLPCLTSCAVTLLVATYSQHSHALHHYKHVY